MRNFGNHVYNYFKNIKSLLGDDNNKIILRFFIYSDNNNATIYKLKLLHEHVFYNKITSSLFA